MHLRIHLYFHFYLHFRFLENSLAPQTRPQPDSIAHHTFENIPAQLSKMAVNDAPAQRKKEPRRFGNSRALAKKRAQAAEKRQKGLQQPGRRAQPPFISQSAV